ncbi:hypothetical protein [Cognataquiflexum rubidum]|uniref:hypothetical protein n=1 Tax=Cognataquiflexum rubidum TaxID=2922273 RepID=UPI001F138CD8|nr:hypothetical protein [Cognataquiflexum rubidum]MCH6236367.1 hypothetical protein [Cognataquiflexum rubidum]
MQSVFSHIATFQYFHEYHAMKSADIFQLKIPKETQKILSNLNLIIKPFESGFHLLSGNSSLLPNELKPLRFHFQVKDPLFWNYTELEGFYPQKNLIFHSNLFPTEENETETKGKLIDQNALFNIYKGMKFPFELITSQNPIVLDELGNSIEVDPNGSLGEEIEEEGSFTLPSNTEVKKIYFFPDQLFVLPGMVFSLHIAKLLEDILSNYPISYQVNFKARATKWRYILADQDLNKKPSLGIKDLRTNSYTFTEKQIEINGPGTVRCFESDQEIILKNSATVDFQLVENSKLEEGEKIVISHLPTATPEYLHHEDSSPNHIYSHIFI